MMERLTYDFVVGGDHCWEIHGADNLLCKEVCVNQGDSGCENCPIRMAIDRLAAYEDTGLTPEEVSEYQHLCETYVEAGLDSKFVQACIDATKRGVTIEQIVELGLPNDPLALEEMREMGGEPVWCEEHECWGIVACDTVGVWANRPFLVGVRETSVNFEYDIEARSLTLYRRKPEEVQNG